MFYTKIQNLGKTLARPLQGINLNTTDEQLPVQMWPGHAPCAANRADNLTLPHDIAHFDLDLVLMPIT